MFPPKKEVSRGVARMGIQVMTHRRVMVIPIRGLRRKMIVMIHCGTGLSSGDITCRGPAGCDR